MGTIELLDTITSSTFQTVHSYEKTGEEHSPVLVSAEIYKLLSMYLKRFRNFAIQLKKKNLNTIYSSHYH